MPDWAVHLAVGAGLGKTFRLRNLHLLLLGAILPDLTAVLGTLSDLGWLGIDPARIVLFIVPLGSPFGMTCLALILACGMNRFWPAFGLMLGGLISHYLLDIFQNGHVEILLYPFSFEIINLPLFNYADHTVGWISGAALIVLVTLRFFPIRRDIRFSAKRAWLGIFPAVLLATVIITNAPRLLNENKFYLQFLLGAPVPENSVVTIYSGKVVQSQPLVVKKLKRQIEVVWPETIAEGKLVIAQGRFSNNKIIADFILPLAAGRKIIFSLLAMLVFVVYWIKIPLLDNSCNHNLSNATGRSGANDR